MSAHPSHPAGEFHSRVPPSEPSVAKWHKPGNETGSHIPEFHAETYPPGTAPSKDTFQPNSVSETARDVNDSHVDASPRRSVPAQKSASHDPPASHASGKDRSAEKEQGGPAPTYVQSQYLQDPKPPHGKNLTENFDRSGKFEDGLQKANQAEPGSEDDPGRAAVQALRGQGAGGHTKGAREHGISGEGQYDVLKEEAA